MVRKREGGDRVVATIVYNDSDATLQCSQPRIVPPILAIEFDLEFSSTSEYSVGFVFSLLIPARLVQSNKRKIAKDRDNGLD